MHYGALLEKKPPSADKNDSASRAVQPDADFHLTWEESEDEGVEEALLYDATKEDDMSDSPSLSLKLHEVLTKPYLEEDESMGKATSFSLVVPEEKKYVSIEDKARKNAHMEGLNLKNNVETELERQILDTKKKKKKSKEDERSIVDVMNSNGVPSVVSEEDSISGNTNTNDQPPPEQLHAYPNPRIDDRVDSGTHKSLQDGTQYRVCSSRRLRSQLLAENVSQKDEWPAASLGFDSSDDEVPTVPFSWAFSRRTEVNTPISVCCDPNLDQMGEMTVSTDLDDLSSRKRLSSMYEMGEACKKRMRVTKRKSVQRKSNVSDSKNEKIHNVGRPTSQQIVGTYDMLEFYPRSVAHVKRKKTQRQNSLFRGMSFLVSGLRQRSEFAEVLRKKIRSGGGMFVSGDSLSTHLLSLPVPRTGRISSSVLLSDRPRRTIQYISALAFGIPCLHYNWILHCIEMERLLPMQEYMLPAGFSLETGDMSLVLQSSRCYPLDGISIELVGPGQSRWAMIARAIGVRIVSRLFTPAESHLHAVMVTAPPPYDLHGPLLQRIRQLGIPLFTPEWLIQCVINRKRLLAEQCYRYTYFEQWKAYHNIKEGRLASET